MVTPEIAYLPAGRGSHFSRLSAKGGGVGDVSATLIHTLFEQGVDIHVAIPDYRRVFNKRRSPLAGRNLDAAYNQKTEERIHLARDRSLFYVDQIACGGGAENLKHALNFQREVINQIVPRVKPDLIHCHDWMTGLIPAMTRRLKIPCLFTLHNIYTEKCLLSHIEDVGIDAAYFWRNLYYDRYPQSYEKARDTNPVNSLASGIFAAHFVNTVSPTFLMEIINGRHSGLDQCLCQELAYKHDSECAVGILNAPDPSYNPLTDKALFRRFSARDHYAAKQYNKLFLQEKLGLLMDSRAPVFFWPSRLDPGQKGCRLLAEILYEILCRYRGQNLQMVFVADGEFKKHFKDIIGMHQLNGRVAVYDYEERLSRRAYAASDFVLIPSCFEPCGLPQMIGPLYGALPVAYDTGGLHDTVIHLDVDHNTGNGFLFKNHDTGGLYWAIKEAMRFYNLSPELKSRQVERVMTQSAADFRAETMTSQYIQLYEQMLERPLFN